MRAQIHIEPTEGERVVHADVSVALGGLEAELTFADPPQAFGWGERTGTASARLLPPAECFIPPRSETRVPAAAGALLGVEFRDGESAPLGRVVAIPPMNAGIAFIDASLEVLAAIHVIFTWAGAERRADAEILVGGDIRFPRGVIGRLMFRTESPSGPEPRRRLSWKDVTFLRPGQTIHFPEQFVPVSGGAKDLARVRYRFGGAPADERGAAGA